MLIICFVLAVLIGVSGVAQASESVSVFQAVPIQFGDPASGATWVSRDEGRIVRSTVELPRFSEPVKITARLKLESAGDPWDRFGTVYLVPQAGEPHVELLKFMTGFGTGLPYKRDDIPDHPSVEKWAEHSVWEADLSHLASLLQGEVTIEAIIDTWVNPGWLMDFELVFAVDADVRTPDWVAPVFNNTGEYWTKEVFASEAASFEVEIPEGLEAVQMFYLTSGHGGRSSGDEFNKKDHVIYVDEQEVLRFVPWREDGPLFRAFSPTSAKWEGDVWSSDLSRSNWIPGDQVKPMIFELGRHLTPGKHIIRLEVENMAESTPDNLNYWNISVVLVGYENNPLPGKKLTPFLQAPNPTGITISWAHNSDYASVVNYGLSETLNQKATGNTELIAGEIVWHSVHLRDLAPETTYYYQVHSGLSSSSVQQFTTPPAHGSMQAITLGLVGATTNPEAMELVLTGLRDEVRKRNGNLHLVLHTGNVVPDAQVADEYLKHIIEPFSNVLPQVPVHRAPGDLEQEALYLYQFAHNDAFDDYFPTSAYADRHGRLGEETYQFRLGRTMFLVFNTNDLGLNDINWLEQAVKNAHQDPQIDNLVVLVHKRLENLTSYVQNRVKTHLGQTDKPLLLIHGDGQGVELGQSSAWKFLSLGHSDGGDLSFVLLGIDPKQKSLTLEVFGFDTETGSARLLLEVPIW